MKRPKDPHEHLEKLQSLLEDFAESLDRPDLRQRVRGLIPSFKAIRKLGVSLMPEHSKTGARERILAYFLKHPKTILDGDELMVISGIGEWARRVRELRVEDGWLINSGATYKQMAADLQKNETEELVQKLGADLGVDPRKMKTDQYVLVSVEQDRHAAWRWRQLNKVRKSSASVRDKVLTYLQQNVGVPVPGEELRYLSPKTTEWARRVRELRTEYGWAVASRMSGRPDLPVGVYVLEHKNQARENDRQIKDAVRVEVLERDGHKCRICGWEYDQKKPGDPRNFLELHHLEHHVKGGENTVENLVTLCNVHHDQVHSSDAKGREIEAKLLSD